MACAQTRFNPLAPTKALVWNPKVIPSVSPKAGTSAVADSSNSGSSSSGNEGSSGDASSDGR